MVTFFRYSLLIVISSFSLIFSQNHSLSFDGVDDYVELPDIDLSSDFTLSAKILNANEINNYFGIIHKYPSYSLTGQPEGYIYSHPPYPNSPANAPEGCHIPDLPSPGEWYDVTMVMDNGTVYLYLDGENVDICEGAGYAPDHDNNTLIGKTDFGGYHNGNLDEVRIWSIALTQDQIQAHMNTPLSGDESGLVGYWNFNDGEGTVLTDLSGNGNHGTITGATWSDDGAPVEPIVQESSPNYSLSFDNGDNVNIGNPESFALDDFSISFWFNSAYIAGDGDWRYILGKHNSYHFELYGNGKLRFGFEQSGGWGSIDSDPGLNDGSWHHVTATRHEETGFFNLFINGELVDNQYLFNDNGDFSNLTGTLENDFNFYIGALYEGHHGPFTGKIDELSIYDYVLSQEQIQNNLNRSLSGFEDGLIAHYNFNEANGNTLFDITGNSNDGIINGATWSDDGAPVQPLEELDTIATVTLSEVDTYIFPGYIGDTALVAVNADLGDIDLYSSEMHFTGFQGVLGFEGIVTEGTPMGDADWNVIVNEQEEVLITGNYGSDAISGDVTLFYLQFSVGDSLAEDSISIELSHVELNEEEGEIETFDGSVIVSHLLFGDVTQNDDVSMMDAANVLRYIVGSVDFDKYQMSAADVTMDESISALDASVVAQYAVGLVESLPHSEGTDGQGFLTINEGLEYQTGEILEVPVMLTGGNNLLSFEVDLTYDPNQVTVEGIDWSDQIDHFTIEENNEPGSIRVAGSGTTPDGQDGIFATLRLQVLETTTEQSIDLTINKIRINESAPVEDVMVSITQEVLSTDNATVPNVYALHQNYPNPFNPTTKISYDLPEASVVSLFIYDLMGREIRTMINSEQTAGFKNIQWNATDNLGKSVPAGMYIYTIQAGEFRKTRKMVLLK